MDLTLTIHATPDAMFALAAFIETWHLTYPETVLTLRQVVVPPHEVVTGRLVNQITGLVGLPWTAGTALPQETTDGRD